MTDRIFETVTIRKWNKNELENRIKKFNRRASKLAVVPMAVEFDNERILPIHIPVGQDVFGGVVTKEIMVTCVDAHVSYSIPVIEGWELICNFDANKDPEGNIVVFTSKVPDKELPKKFMEKDEVHCDHCGINRWRKKSYLMRNVETGEYKEVGSTCVKDFFGHDPKGFIYAASFDYFKLMDFSGADDEMGYDGYRGYGYDCGTGINEWLSMTSAVIREHGWVSKTKAYHENLAATAHLVAAQIYSGHKMKERDRIEVLPDDVKIAKETVKWFEELDAEGNDYLMNCKKVVQIKMVPYKMEGVAASMVATYKRELYKKEEIDRKKKEGKDSEYVGELKERLRDLTLKVVYTQDIESMYGVSTLYIFVDEETGNKFKTFYSGNSYRLYKDDLVKVTGTVKKHEEYKGEKSTMLTRVIAEIIVPEDRECCYNCENCELGSDRIGYCRSEEKPGVIDPYFEHNDDCRCDNFKKRSK